MEEKTKGIYKRNEGRWEARFRVGVNADGRARYRSVYAQTKEAVIAKRQAAEAEILAAKTRKRPTEFNLLIIGAGTHGRDVYEIARSLHVFRKNKLSGRQRAGREHHRQVQRFVKIPQPVPLRVCRNR